MNRYFSFLAAFLLLFLQAFTPAGNFTNTLAKGHIMVDIDIKTSHLKPVVDVVKRTGTVAQVFYFDNDYDALKTVRSLDQNAHFMPILFRLMSPRKFCPGCVQKSYMNDDLIAIWWLLPPSL